MNKQTDSPEYREALEDHGAAARSAGRLPVGSRADVCDDRALHDRGSLRGGRRDRARSARRASRASSAICCSRWCSTHEWRKKPGCSTSRPWRPTSATSSSGGIRTCSAMQRSRTAPSRRGSGRTSRRQERASAPARVSVLDDVPAKLPGLSRAVKLGKRAATVGLRLARYGGCAREGHGGDRRARCRSRERQRDGGRRRDGRPAVHDRELVSPSESRPRHLRAGRERQIRAAVPRRGGGGRRERSGLGQPRRGGSDALWRQAKAAEA